MSQTSAVLLRTSAILILAILCSCSNLRPLSPGSTTIGKNPNLAVQFKRLSGYEPSSRSLLRCYKQGRRGIYTHHHIGSHWCYEQFLLQSNDSLYELGMRTDTASFRDQLTRFGFSERARTKAMAAISETIALPCGGPKF